MTPVLLIVGLLILAAVVVAIGLPRARTRRTVVVERVAPVQRVVQTHVVQTPVVQTPVVQPTVIQTPVVQTPVIQTPVAGEIVDERY